MGVDIRGILEARKMGMDELKGVYAVDAYNVLYQFLSVIRGPDGMPLSDSRGRTTSHLSGLFYRGCKLVENGVKPVFVFDGKPSIFKKKTLEERKERKIEAEKKLEEARKRGDEEEIRVYAQQTARLTDEMVADAKELAELMGFPIVQAESEGEAECARMNAGGMVDGVISQDFDTLLFGGKRLVRNVTIAGKRKLPRKNVSVEVFPEEILLEPNLKRLEISRRQLVWIGMLCGTDFDEGIMGIGPKKGLKAVQGKGNFEEVLAGIGKEMEGWEEIEKLFLEERKPIAKKGEIVFREPDKEGLIEFMCEKHDFMRERIENAVKKAVREPEDAGQGTLKKWF